MSYAVWKRLPSIARHAARAAIFQALGGTACDSGCIAIEENLRIAPRGERGEQLYRSQYPNDPFIERHGYFPMWLVYDKYRLLREDIADLFVVLCYNCVTNRVNDRRSERGRKAFIPRENMFADAREERARELREKNS